MDRNRHPSDIESDSNILIHKVRRETCLIGIIGNHPPHPGDCTLIGHLPCVSGLARSGTGRLLRYEKGHGTGNLNAVGCPPADIFFLYSLTYNDYNSSLFSW